MSELLYPIKVDYIGKIKSPSPKWYPTSEVGVAVNGFREPVLLYSIFHLCSDAP